MDLFYNFGTSHLESLEEKAKRLRREGEEALSRLKQAALAQPHTVLPPPPTSGLIFILISTFIIHISQIVKLIFLTMKKNL